MIQPVHGQSTVLINEFQVEPEQQIEVWNGSAETVNLTGWVLDDSSGSTFFTIPENSLAPSQSCLVFKANFYLNKSSADTVRLFNPLGELIDSYSYDKSPGENVSWQRNPHGSANWTVEAANFGDCLVVASPTIDLPTPTVQNTPGVLEPTGTPTPAPVTNVYLSEIMPYPDDEAEWVELYNANDFTINLENWYLDDGVDTGSTPKLFSLTIEGKSYTVIELSSSIFNNDQDTVRLLNWAQTEVDSAEYHEPPKGQSYSRQSWTPDTTWCFTIASKNAGNINCPLEPTLVLGVTSVLLDTSTPVEIKTVTPLNKILPADLKLETSLYKLPRQTQVLGAQTAKINPGLIAQFNFWHKYTKIGLWLNLLLNAGVLIYLGLFLPPWFHSLSG